MKIRFLIAFSAAIGIGIGSFALSGCSERTDSFKGKPEKVTIGLGQFEASGLAFIAEELGFFRKRGLDVSLQVYEAGVHSVDALLRNELDIATAGEFVFVRQSSEQSDLRILASIAAADNCYLVAKKDGPISHPKDLRGKRIATVRGTNSDFFLMTFLWNNGLSPDSVQTLDIKPSASLDALMKDQVDAIVSYGAFFLECQKSLGEKALVWPVQEGQEYYFLALSRENLIKSRPLTIERFLAALADAETFQKEKSAEARKIIGRYLKVDDSYLAAALPRTRLTLRLDQGLLILMEEEAKWALRNQLIDNKQVPNYFHSIYLDGLEKVKPEAVTVIH